MEKTMLRVLVLIAPLGVALVGCGAHQASR
jgi:hypothetical protein